MNDKRFWISWVQKSDDYRPIHYPPHENILGWWCSGYDENDTPVLCAAVQVKSESEIMAVIESEWPEAGEYVDTNGGWRFIESKSNDWKPSSRFPFSDWMIKRFNKESQ